MSTLREREYLKGIYPNAKWSKKVDRMADDQVLAVYFRFTTVKIEAQTNPDPEPEIPDDQQLRLF